ncbi:hypothetical protein BV898_10402 [Hypsibius exemplaris]|uniref:Uncharacterized protein n=1 Tax=Hypsibius exemplaris TaxID=2072580 RepID=A0A1W0WJQ9_HYPEX|nr:hypothetical protein BV898_10402 [Hypsibius exemplaris]
MALVKVEKRKRLQKSWIILHLSNFPLPGTSPGEMGTYFALTGAAPAYRFSCGAWIPFVGVAGPRWQSERYGFLLDTLSSSEEASSPGLFSPFSKPRRNYCAEFLLDPHLASRIVYCLRESPEFCAFLYSYLRQKYSNASSKTRGPLSFRVFLDWSQNNKFDEPWEHRIWTLCMWNELVREHLAWLSTLGGAFSSLGKIGFSAFAEKAGKISVSQWRLSTYLNDSVLGCRSRIFFAISRIQQRRFKIAETILRNELQFCRQAVVASESEKLESIIRSVWDYLVHEKCGRARTRREQRELKERADRLMFDDGTIRAKKSLADTILAMSKISLPKVC